MNLDPTVTKFLTELKDSNFEICYELDCLSKNNKDTLFEWINDNCKPEILYGRTNFDSIYTFDKASWDSGCSPRKNKPLILIDYVFKTNNMIGLAYKAGGLAIQKKLAIISINNKNETLTIHRDSEKLTDLIIELTQTKTQN